jgi:hypothetical protein
MKNNNSIISSTTGFITGSMTIFASTCGVAGGACGAVCGTTAISLFGLGSGTTGAFLNKWQPLFIGISIIAFVYSFYNLYFRKPKIANCATDATCKCPPKMTNNIRFQKIFLWTALALSIGFYSYPLFAKSNLKENVQCANNKSCTTPCEQKTDMLANQNVIVQSDTTKPNKCNSNSECEGAKSCAKASKECKISSDKSCSKKTTQCNQTAKAKTSSCDTAKVCSKPCGGN